jgi:hypothetical protein
MSVAAINIVREEIARRKNNQPNIHCAHDMLDTLEARIVDRIEKELVEIPEPLVEKYKSLIGTGEFPLCPCGESAVYEGWANRRDTFTGQPSSMCQRLFVCGTHKHYLKGAAS